ncbi:potassium channel beta subunit family protein [Raineya orbicola]|jgi:voltage-dependent potassium channel beta subunit|uniref:Putative oxidoreductase n=1 Tax=Raineya orbicola TaxID=2016530 RepID=A0A2N3IAA8_9BACT|nr:aldo/keto reductase [Raineya orbicola]PKQ67237.1 putative oxidoreductase [Raineya orbicola]
MEYRRLGKSGLQVSVLSLGSWLTFGKQIANSTAEELMKIAYDNGINFFDNAEIYARGQSEIVMGNILKKMGWARDTFVVSSKVFFGAGGKLPNQTGLSRKHVFEACHAALKRLQVEYLDLYFCHRPDKNTPIEETVWAMNDLIRQGKVLYWGTSEWSAQEIQEAYGIARQYNLIPPTMEQPQYNMFHRYRVEIEYAQLYKNIGLGTTIWSPLASGILTGKYNDGFPTDTRLGMEGMEWLKNRELVAERIEKVKKLSALANELGVAMPTLAIAWTIKPHFVSTAILGASKASQLQENLKAIEIAQNVLNNEIMQKIEEILQNKPEMPAF